ncbi:hypothetical protein KM043_004791 [Ampulex compressa]|nr:hypothetical protein KM043_004791 [Ampulex compressa]
MKILSREGVLLGEAKEIDDVYLLEAFIVNTEFPLEVCQSAEKIEEKKLKINDKELWYKRLGLICQEYLDRLKRDRSDNGREFVNNIFNELFRSRGIKRELTVAYNPQRDGVAERANRTILDKTRTMLIGAKLPALFWAEAANTAAYLKNIYPVKGGENETPYQKWSGKQPTVSYLKVFGCVAYYYIHKNFRNKFEPKARKGIFIGYSRETRAYRVYDPEIEAIIAVRTAKFDENRKGSDLIKDRMMSEKQKQEEEEEILLRPIESTQGEVQKLAEGSDQGQDKIFEEAQEEISPRIERKGKIERKPGITNEEVQWEHKMRIEERENQLVQQGARRSERLANKNQQANISTDTKKETIPKSFEEAINGEGAPEWRKAMEREIRSMDDHRTWDLTPRRKG